MKDSLLIDQLKIRSSKAYDHLYEQYFGLVEIHVLRNSGNLMDAEDLFQDTLIVLVEKLQKDDFILSASLKTYIMAIAKNLWLKKLRGKKPREQFGFKHEKAFYEEMQLSIERENTYRQKLKSLFNRLTEHCSQLLHDIYYKLKSIVQIKEEYGYSSKHTAQNQKHKCVKQLRELQSKK